MSVLLLAQLVHCQSPNPHTTVKIRKQTILKYALVKRLFCTTCKIFMSRKKDGQKFDFSFRDVELPTKSTHQIERKENQYSWLPWLWEGSLTRSKCVCRNIHLLPLTFEPASIVSIHPFLMPFHWLIVGLLHHKDPRAKAPNARTLAPSSVYLFQCNFQSIFKWNFGEF